MKPSMDACIGVRCMLVPAARPRLSPLVLLRFGRAALRPGTAFALKGFMDFAVACLVFSLFQNVHLHLRTLCALSEV